MPTSDAEVTAQRAKVDALRTELADSTARAAASLHEQENDVRLERLVAEESALSAAVAEAHAVEAAVTGSPIATPVAASPVEAIVEAPVAAVEPIVETPVVAVDPEPRQDRRPR